MRWNHTKKKDFLIPILITAIFMCPVIGACSFDRHLFTKSVDEDVVTNMPTPPGLVANVSENAYELFKNLDFSSEDFANPILKNEFNLAPLYIDFSRTNLGIVSIHIDNIIEKKIRISIHKSDMDFENNKTDLAREYKSGEYPLVYGSGNYILTIYGASIHGAFQSVFTVEFYAEFDESMPYSFSNINSTYSRDSYLAKKSYELTHKISDPNEIAQKIAAFLYANFAYDEKTQYYREDIGDCDLIYKRGTGVCYHFSALFSAMMKSRGIPTREVRGTIIYPTGEQQYHSWNEYYSNGQWHQMDVQNLGMEGILLFKEKGSER